MMNLVTYFIKRVTIRGFARMMALAVIFTLVVAAITWTGTRQGDLNLGSMQSLEWMMFWQDEEEPPPKKPIFVNVGALGACASYICPLDVEVTNGGDHDIITLTVDHPQFQWKKNENLSEVDSSAENFNQPFSQETERALLDTSGWAFHFLMRGMVGQGKVPGMKFPTFKATSNSAEGEENRQMFWLAPDGAIEVVGLGDGQGWLTWLQQRLQVDGLQPTLNNVALNRLFVDNSALYNDTLLLAVESAKVKRVELLVDYGVCIYLPDYLMTDSAETNTTQGACNSKFTTGDLQLRDNEKIFLELPLCTIPSSVTTPHIKVTIINEDDAVVNAPAIIDVDTALLETCAPLADLDLVPTEQNVSQ